MFKERVLLFVVSGPETRLETLYQAEAIAYAQNVYRRTKVVCTIEEVPIKARDWTAPTADEKEAA